MRMRAVEVIESAFVPLPGAKFSMRTEMLFHPQIPRNGSRGRLNGLANVVDQSFDDSQVVAFGHHPDQRLRARFADDEPAPALKLSLRRGDALPHTIGFERLAGAVEANVL